MRVRALPNSPSSAGWRKRQVFAVSGYRACWTRLLDSRDPFTNLSVLATVTKRLLLGPIAVNPFDMHPVRIASSLMTLNELANGRARIVIGGGGEALDAVGIKPLRRVRAVAECVDIIKAAASGEDVDYEGELYEVHKLRFGWLRAARHRRYSSARAWIRCCVWPRASPTAA